MKKKLPAITLFFLSPLIAELLLSSAPPVEFFNPIMFVVLTVLYGGGAILIAANGTITVNGRIEADGGYRGGYRLGTCSSCGGGGSGGAIRLVAYTITGTGTLRALGGSGCFAEGNGSDGGIRLEAFANTFNAGIA